MRRTLLCTILLVSGCYQDYYNQRIAQWETWRTSFARGDLIGKSINEVIAVWGKADEVEQSIIGDTRMATLIYVHKGYDPDWGAIVPVETYHLVFVNGYLESCHKF